MPTENIDNVNLNRWNVFHDDVISPWDAAYSVGVGNTLIPIRPKRLGGEAVGSIRGARDEPFTITYLQATKADVQHYLGLSALPADGAAPGSAAVYKKIALHDPAVDAEDKSGDIIYWKCAAGRINFVELEGGVRGVEVQWMPHVDDEGRVWSIGEPEEE